MVYGLEKFKEYFGEYTNQYVFIGGTACDIVMDELLLFHVETVVLLERDSE